LKRGVSAVATRRGKIIVMGEQCELSFGPMGDGKIKYSEAEWWRTAL